MLSAYVLVLAAPVARGGDVDTTDPAAARALGADATPDWDWEGVTDAPAPGQSSPGPAPAPGSTIQAPEADGSSDWDWEGVTDAPAPGRSPGGPSPAAVSAGRADAHQGADSPRIGATAEPDFEAPARPGVSLFPGAPPFEVIASRKDPEMHPCIDCHEWAQSNPEPRVLGRPHDNFALDHGLLGKGEFWCFTCHHLEGDGGIRTLEGGKLEFDDAYLVCAQCHSREARDWTFGAHGKRVGNWQGERRILNCTACHYQHDPALKPRRPRPPPPVRNGLSRREHAPPSATRIWDQIQHRPQ